MCQALGFDSTLLDIKSLDSVHLFLLGTKEICNAFTRGAGALTKRGLTINCLLLC